MNYMNVKCLLAVSLACFFSMPVVADNDADDVDMTPKVHGTIRGKYEYQPEDGEGGQECPYEHCW